MKKFQMILSKQDLLDNIIWLLGRAEERKTLISSPLSRFLIETADALSSYIYSCRVDLTSYYRAWRLRGDDPELYANPSGLEESYYASENFSTHFLKNSAIDDKERLEPAVYLWYHRYHFDKEVREKGEEKITFGLESALQQDYVRFITDTQAQLLMEIKQREVYIETNPSSNFLIGPFSRYENHPIFCFFGVKDFMETGTCVSINTDDLGVFDTSLQNEYALLATALSKRGRYSKAEIMAYLESIQAFGNKQRFL